MNKQRKQKRYGDTNHNENSDDIEEEDYGEEKIDEILPLKSSRSNRSKMQFERKKSSQNTTPRIGNVSK